MRRGGGSVRQLNRVGVVETVYFQEHGESPNAVQFGFSHSCTTDEQHFGPRKFVAGTEWRRLPCGWLESGASQLHLRNTMPQLMRQPTVEERGAISRRVVQLRQAGGAPFARVRPGESCRLEPEDAASIEVRCLEGEAECKLILYPA